jgi:hypothetical protein
MSRPTSRRAGIRILAIGARLFFAIVLLAPVLTASVWLPAAADSIVLPPIVPRSDASVTAIYHLSPRRAGTGTLTVDWIDTYGRLVDHLVVPIPDGLSDVAFPLDMRRAVATRNELRARVDFDGAPEPGKASTAFSFVAAPSDRDWRDYRIIIWQSLEPAQYATLRGWGVTAGMVLGNRDDDGDPLDPAKIAPLLDADLRWYVENLATDFYSAYHRWFPDRPVNWRFLQVRQSYRDNADDMVAFRRVPSLSDPSWLARIRARLDRSVRAHSPYTPLYYSLGDETGIADLSAFWDFDFSEPSLRGMRDWLKVEYGSLAALNAEWGTNFHAWDQVVAMTTREAMRRADGNFSAWADHKAWMDVAFARALRAGTEAVHGADPAAYAGIEGAQIPGWGGYDYTQLATAVDLMELYDYEDNVGIVRSLNPKVILLATAFIDNPAAAIRIWKGLVRGERGLILWDPANRLTHPDGSPAAVGRRLAPTLQRITSGLGALLINSTPWTDPVAILYSPASFRTRWMLDHQPLGEAWSDRDAAAEYEDNDVRAATRADRQALERLGLQYRFISPSALERGELERANIRVLMLPGAIAMSSAEVAEVRRFVGRGGFLIADTQPAQFDQHSRRLPSAALVDIFRGERAILSPLGRADRNEQIAAILDQADIRSHVTIVKASGDPDPGVEMHLLRNGQTTIVAVSGPPLAKALVAKLAKPSFVYDVLSGRSLGRTDQVSFAMDDVGEALFAISPEPVRAPTISLRRQARPGDVVDVEIRIPDASPDAHRAVRIGITDPSGRTVSYYSRIMLTLGTRASLVLPLAYSDPVGRWQIRATDVLSGQQATTELQVSP